MKRIFFALMFAAAAVSSVSAQDQNREFRGGDFRMGIDWPEPKVVTPGETPKDAPSDALVLFDGS